MEIIEEISYYLQRGEGEKVASLTRQALEKLSPKEILDNGLIAGMNVIGAKYKAHEIFLPDVLLAAKAMYAGMDVLKPHFLKEGIPFAGKVVIGSVRGDLHDIGKNLVAIMLRGAGFEIVDLGNDVSPEKFVESAKRENASVIGMSALLTTTMPEMRNVIELVREQGLADRIKTIVGGAPVSVDFAHDIGADAYGYDSVHAVEQVKRLVREKR